MSPTFSPTQGHLCNFTLPSRFFLILPSFSFTLSDFLSILFFPFDFRPYINWIYTMISIQFIHSFNFSYFPFNSLIHLFIFINPKFTKFRAFLLSIHIRLIESFIVHIFFELAILSLNWAELWFLAVELVNCKRIRVSKHSIGQLEEN